MEEIRLRRFFIPYAVIVVGLSLIAFFITFAFRGLESAIQVSVSVGLVWTIFILALVIGYTKGYKCGIKQPRDEKAVQVQEVSA